MEKYTLTIDNKKHSFDSFDDLINFVNTNKTAVKERKVKLDDARERMIDAFLNYVEIFLGEPLDGDERAELEKEFKDLENMVDKLMQKDNENILDSIFNKFLKSL